MLIVLIWSLKLNILTNKMPCLVLNHFQVLIRYFIFSVLDYHGEWVQFIQRTNVRVINEISLEIKDGFVGLLTFLQLSNLVLGLVLTLSMRITALTL